ncbi:MAG: RNA 2',3'-cyclic phosphodiesterase [Desulfobacterota bacterium]|nr:RNA 2',3'-cyclic phosphodiesterase [Thermodesulfobacteriota bacterium]
MATDILRTFIALDIPDWVRGQVGRLQQHLMRCCQGVRWVKPEHMHLTLKFLGPTRPEQIDRIKTLLIETVRGVAPFVFDIAGLGAFPNTKNPKVIWAGIAADEHLVSFQARLETGLEKLGFQKEKRTFSPHLTLGRVRDGAHRKDIGTSIERHAGETIGRVETSRIVLFRSDLTPSGPVYSVLADVHVPKRQ